jgi:multidrug efflux pump subunit AcrA (membrane-fusion protein)
LYIAAQLENKRKFMKALIWVWIGLFAFILPAKTWAAIAPNAATEDHPKVLLQEIKPLEDKRRVIVPVKVEAKIQSLVTADIEGHVTKILKPLGATVKAGEVILYLENRDPGFTYAAVPVRAPVSGVLSYLWATQMAKMSRGDKLFTVINPKSLKLTAEFPSSDLGIVRTGLSGEFSSESQRDLKLGVRIVGISPLVDARTGTAAAEFELMNSSSGRVLPPPIGTVGQATFEITQGSIFMVPEASIIFQDGKPMVRVMNAEHKVGKKSVELGEQRDSSFVIKSGVLSGDQVVVRASRPLKETDIVEVEKSEEKTR